MIERLEIQNVRSFKGLHLISMRPITLIYGPNSAGKSSIIQSLVLLKQTLAPHDSSDAARPALRLRGDEVDLGNFLTIVHGHDPDAELSVGVRTSRSTSVPSVKTGPPGQGPFGVGLGFKLSDESEVVPASSTLIGGEVELRFSPHGDGNYRLDDAGALVPLLEEYIARLDDADDTIEDVLKHLQQRAKDRRRGPLEFLAHDHGEALFPTLPVHKQFDVTETDMRFGGWFAKTATECLDAVRGTLRELSYLGPMRVPPTRFQELKRLHSRDVGRSGQYTTSLLRDSELRDLVNKWLAHLEIDYRIEVKDLDAQGSDLVVTSLIDTRVRKPAAELAVTPQDVGYGVSQLLPVIVQLLIDDRATVCVEQPEVHIHPRLQARLADLFVLAIKRGKQVVVETHSEAFMLRLQGRMREGHLTPEEIGVWYVDTDDSSASSYVRQLPQRDNGTFTEEWPDGFFAERFNELTAKSFPPYPEMK